MMEFGKACALLRCAAPTGVVEVDPEMCHKGRSAEQEHNHTLGVCDLTLPARASDPWTLPMIAVERESVGF